MRTTLTIGFLAAALVLGAASPLVAQSPGTGRGWSIFPRVTRVGGIQRALKGRARPLGVGLRWIWTDRPVPNGGPRGYSGEGTRDVSLRFVVRAVRLHPHLGVAMSGKVDCAAGGRARVTAGVVLLTPHGALVIETPTLRASTPRRVTIAFVVGH